MKKPASFHTATSVMQASAVRWSPSQLCEGGHATRQEINELLLPKLSEALTSQQKLNKINNLLTSLRRNGTIRNEGIDRFPRWVLQSKNSKLQSKKSKLQSKT